jgi:glycosyltransferase involved in cell wall biosynthesis
MKLKIILIGNYKLDNQYSMQIFEALMAQGYTQSDIIVKIIRPTIFFGKAAFNNSKLIKWLAYIDKFAIFPLNLLFKRSMYCIFFQNVHYHICDHSNAFYLHFLPKNKTVITCHDVLAIKAGLGYTDTYCTATKSGQRLQKIILNALSGARKLASVSNYTLNQLTEIDTRPQLQKKWVCIHNVLSDKFLPLSTDETSKILYKFENIKNKAFLLHIGSNLERKNRNLLIQLLHEIKNEWAGVVVFAGAPLSKELRKLINILGVSDRIIEIQRPTNTEIIALYSSCQAMVFPSYTEGFGWPIIEAQACGAPVITSNKAPMMGEVGGLGALYADPNDPISFANQFRKIKDTSFREKVIQLGFENTKRFDFGRTIRQYINLIENK